MIIGNLNINSIRNKLAIERNCATVYRHFCCNLNKLDETFLESLFLMDGFSKPYRLGRNKNRGL